MSTAPYIRDTAHVAASSPQQPRCLYCGSPGSRILYTEVPDRLGHVPGTRTWARCDICESAILDPQPRVEDLASYYPAVYSFTPELGKKSRLASICATIEHRFFFGPQYRTQAKVISQASGQSGPGRKILDVGCGRGLLLKEFQRLGYEPYGLDLQPDVVRYVSQELGIPAVCCDISQATEHYDAGSFDIVTAFYLMEHVPDVAGFLTSCRRLLRPGGTIAVAVPLLDSIQSHVFGKRWIHVGDAPRHLSLPTRDGVARVFERAGFGQPTFVGDALFNCAGGFASSAVRGATLTHAYAKPGILSFLPRLLGGAVMIGSIPLCWIENEMLARPSMAIAIARVPMSGGHDAPR